jgi:D-3-phosphoglycerate dehydrogenase
MLREGGEGVRGIFIDADAAMAELVERLRAPDDPVIDVHRAERPLPAELPALIGDHDFVIDDHTPLPFDALRACPALRHVIFLGTGARSYMDPDALARIGITVHTIKGYGDTAVAEHAFALMWAAARQLALMDRAIRAGAWRRAEGRQLTGKTLGLIGMGGMGGEMARLGLGIGMRVLAWNRTPREVPGVVFLPLEQVLEESDVVSLHLLLTEETRGLLDAARLARLKRGAILVNTARGALIDEAALVAALREGRIGHAALDVFAEEPLPPGHPLRTLDNVTLSAHSGFLTPEANETLIRRALEIARRLAAGGADVAER